MTNPNAIRASARKFYQRGFSLPHIAQLCKVSDDQLMEIIKGMPWLNRETVAPKPDSNRRCTCRDQVILTAIMGGSTLREIATQLSLKDVEAVRRRIANDPELSKAYFDTTELRKGKLRDKGPPLSRSRFDPDKCLEILKQGLSTQDIGVKFGLSPNHVWRHMRTDPELHVYIKRRTYERWEVTMRGQALELINNGLSLPNIAKQIGIPYQTLRNHIKTDSELSQAYNTANSARAMRQQTQFSTDQNPRFVLRDTANQEQINAWYREGKTTQEIIRLLKKNSNFANFTKFLNTYPDTGKVVELFPTVEIPWNQVEELLAKKYTVRQIYVTLRLHNVIDLAEFKKQLASRNLVSMPKPKSRAEEKRIAFQQLRVRDSEIQDSIKSGQSIIATIKNLELAATHCALSRYLHRQPWYLEYRNAVKPSQPSPVTEIKSAPVPEPTLAPQISFTTPPSPSTSASRLRNIFRHLLNRIGESK